MNSSYPNDQQELSMNRVTSSVETDTKKNYVRTAVRIGTATLALIGAGFGGVKIAEAIGDHTHENLTTDKHVSYTVEQSGTDSTLYGIAGEAYPGVPDVQDAVSSIESVNHDVDFSVLQAGQNLKMPDSIDNVQVVPQFDDNSKK